jgi:cytochrome c-type biogenesis protein CcmH
VRPWLVGAATVGTVAAVIAGAGAWVAVRAPQQPAAAPRAAAQVVGRVELATAATATALSPDAMVVVYAFALDGPRLPLAVWRRPATALPLDFKLDDSLAPNPAFRLSQAPQLVVGARLGPGEASAAQAGDWVAPSQTVALGSHGVRLVLQPPRSGR